MSTWSEDELSEIAESDDLHIEPFREDGETYGTPTWIWSVTVDDALYVRAYNGQESSWYQAAVRENATATVALLNIATAGSAFLVPLDQNPNRAEITLGVGTNI